MEKIKLAFALLILTIFLSVVFSVGVALFYAKAFVYTLGAGLIVSVAFVVLFLTLTGTRSQK